MTILLDALAALNLLEKNADRYAAPPPLRPLLCENTPQTVLPMVRHSMAILRHWTQLASVVKTGAPRPAAKQHPRPGGRSGGLHRRDAQRLAPHRRRPGRPTGRVALPAFARRGRGVGDVDLRLPSRPAGGCRRDFRPARRDRPGPGPPCRERVCRPGDAGRRRFLQRRVAAAPTWRGSARSSINIHAATIATFSPRCIGRWSRAAGLRFATSSWSPTACSRPTAHCSP